ncbi:MAG: DUF2892 domain-containing protein [Thermoanaerobaculia bacterium]
MIGWSNEASWDRVFRVLLGAAMLAAGLFRALPEPWNTALVVFSFVPLVTGIMGWCPLYALLGVSTCRTKVR